MSAILASKFATIEAARAAYKAAHDAWWAAYMAESRETRFGKCHVAGLPTKTIAAKEELDRVMGEAIARFGDPVAAKGCGTCLQQQVFPGGPRHEASSRCQSGKHSHCTCDTCF